MIWQRYSGGFSGRQRISGFSLKMATVTILVNFWTFVPNNPGSRSSRKSSVNYSEKSDIFIFHEIFQYFHIFGISKDISGYIYVCFQVDGHPGRESEWFQSYYGAVLIKLENKWRWSDFKIIDQRQKILGWSRIPSGWFDWASEKPLAGSLNISKHKDLIARSEACVILWSVITCFLQPWYSQFFAFCH